MNKKNLTKLLGLIPIVLILAFFIDVFAFNDATAIAIRILSLAIIFASFALVVFSIQRQGDKGRFRKFCAGFFYFLTISCALGSFLTSINQDGFELSIITGVFAFTSFLLGGLKTTKNTQPHLDSFTKAAGSKEKEPSKKLLNHYYQVGLSDADINVFRETMADAKQQIVELQTTMTAVPKLRAINLNHDTLEVSKAMFAALVREPQRLQEAADFLYKHLPSSVQIAKKYQEINRHEIKTADTYAVLDRSVEVLANLSEQMKKDYTNFVADDISDLSSTLDSVNKPQKQPDFSGNSESSIAQMQDQLSQIQKDYLDQQATNEQTTPTSDDSDAQTNKDGDVNHD
ncbi:5-bromo-4-chloroindolyl phosphate hydrolysis family protein [Lapidilactobacillus bayanensis]|uniref:5-bromo-4-chloroindolyl phosphate hydrolysis family protein n=1 Tax=Lapidilactobacillus bayanensis TaxID=2485998 RepID=UPI000F7B3CA0|nr:5-bromo-4-chloroindolyl phosphate hydrolysis family protein [Lapidilactobacillus bayanensis]